MEGFHLRSEKGNMLTITIVSVIMLATLGFILANIVSSSSKVVSLEAEEQRAFYAAQSGLEYGIKEYLAVDNVADWNVSNMDVGSGLSADISLQKIGNDKILISATGKSSKTAKTVQTIISNADSNYVPDYAVFSKKPVVNIVTKDSLTGIDDPGLIYQNAPAVPIFDYDVLRNLAKKTQDDGNAYYYESDLTVDENFNPPDGTVVFTEGKLKFAKGTWAGDVFFVAMDDISFKSTWRNSEEVNMVIYSGEPNKKIWIEPRDFEDDPIEFIVKDGEVIPSEPYAASVTILGCAYAAYTRWGYKLYDAPITTRFKIGNKNKILPWGPDPKNNGTGNNHKAQVEQANVNLPGQFPFTHVFSDKFQAGEAISVRAKGWGRTSSWGHYNYYLHEQANSAKKSDSDIVKALRNGDDVPKVQGFGNQKSAADFIGPYIDFDAGKVSLEDNQVIYLFELSKLQANDPGTDYQDLVVLVTLAKDASDLIINPGPGEAITESILSFKGGIISHSNIYGANVDIVDDEEVVTKLEVVRDEQLLKDFLKYSVNGNARVILDSEWASKN